MEVGFLPYHFALDYAPNSVAHRDLPRVSLSVTLIPDREKSVTLSAIADTGAQVSVFDGSVAIGAGWTTTDIIERASGSLPVYGLGSDTPIPAYLHQVTVLFGTFSRFAELKIRVLVTMPNRLAFSVLGRTDFFEQVDVTFAESDKRLYFRFRDPNVLRDYS